ncbi:hypothetical protein QUB63_33070 [Microcoleus sp. ARI1-B5]|uniref:hypothetical protein n=1 Tax=unclassified Microcoleus TaxID=2642155 RepID=UPI002FD5E0BC
MVQLLSIARHYLSIARHYLSIARHYLSIARHYYRASAIIIERPSLLSSVRHYYRAQCHANRANNLLIMIIALGVGESATGGLSHPYPLFDYHYYPIIFMHKGVLTESTPF